MHTKMFTKQTKKMFTKNYFSKHTNELSELLTLKT